MELRKGIFTGSQLKMIALVAMTFDHIGKMLLPGFIILQIIGRLAFPVFAYMIAEGCRYTKNRKKYFTTMLIAAFVSQIFYSIVMKNLSQCILVSFLLAILTIYALDEYLKSRKNVYLIAFVGMVVLDFVLTSIAPAILRKTGFNIDYGFFGIMLPVFVFIGKTRTQKLIGALTGVFAIALVHGGIQWFSLFSLVLLYLYNGERGSRKLKYLFYIYYPLHIGAIYMVWRYLYLAIRLFKKIF